MAEDMTALYSAKAALRKGMLRTLRQVPEDALVAQSAAVASILEAQPFYKDARTVGCYLSMSKGELRTDELVRDILAKGKDLYTPYLPPSALTGDDNLMHMLRLYSLSDLEACSTDKWGILDPGTLRRDVDHEGEKRGDAMDADSPDLDLILIPGVAFDKQCNRVGLIIHSALTTDGTRQRVLRSLPRDVQRPETEAFTGFAAAMGNYLTPVALALDAQLVENVPVTKDDFSLDAVVSPKGLMWKKVPNNR